MMEENNNQSMINNQEQNKKNPLTIILIIVLILIVLGGVGFYAYQNIKLHKAKQTVEKLKKEEAERQKEENALRVINEDSKEVVDIFNTLTIGIDKCRIEDYFTDQKVTKIDNEKVFSAISNKVLSNQSLTNGLTIQENIITDNIKNYFSSSYNFKHANYNTCPTLTYDSTKKMYTVTNIGCPNICTKTSLMKVTKAEKSDKLMILYARVLFYDKETNQYYKDYKREETIKDLKADSSGRYDTNLYNYSLGEKYKMRFERENNNYVFISSEKEEV